MKNVVKVKVHTFQYKLVWTYFSFLTFSFGLLETIVRAEGNLQRSLYLPLSSVCACMVGHFSCVQLCATPWTVAHQAPLFMGFSRQEHWRGLSCSSPGDLLNPGNEPMSLTSLALAGRFLNASATWEARL